MMLDRGMRSPNAEEFVQEGDALLDALAEAVHAGDAPGPELESDSREFMALGRNFGTAASGNAIRQSGLPDDEVMGMLTSGAWDPFADVQMP